MTSRAQVLIPVFIAAVIIGIAGLVSIPADQKLESTEFPRGTIKLDGILLDVQIADTAPLRIRGLMFQDQLEFDEGMIFIFESSARHSLWMMNMQFAIDMIWFDDEGNVVYIKENAAPCKTAIEAATCTSVVPDSESLYILEATAGFVDMHNITLDSILELVSI